MPIQLPDEIKEPVNTKFEIDDFRRIRREKVARLYMKGYTFPRIAESCNCNVNTILKDMEYIREMWKENALKDFTERLGQELAKLDHLEWCAWQAYEKTTKPAETTHTKTEYAKERTESDNNNNSNLNSNQDERARRLDKKKSKVRDYGQRKDTSPNQDDRRKKQPILSNDRYKGLVPIKMVEELKRVGQAGDPKYLEIILKCIEMRSRICGLFKSDDVNKPTQVVVVPWNELMKGTINTESLNSNKTNNNNTTRLIELKPEQNGDPYNSNMVQDEYDKDDIEKMIDRAGLED
jgi:hypothetical protein